MTDIRSWEEQEDAYERERQREAANIVECDECGGPIYTPSQDECPHCGEEAD